jgi:hypothetical protein
MEGLPSPLLFDKDTAEAMGSGAYWCLVAAYSVAITGNDPHGYRRSYRDHWTGSAAQWRAMARKDSALSETSCDRWQAASSNEFCENGMID